jgi:transposase-like protein
MPEPKPPEFRRRALDLVAQGNPLSQVARDLGISESCLRCGWNARMSMPAAKRV